MYFLQEEEFTGFGTTRIRSRKTSLSLLRQTESPRAPDHTQGAIPLIGKIIPKTPKPALIGKIVPKDSPVKDNKIPKGVNKLQGNQQALTTKARHTNEKALAIQAGIRSTDSIEKTGKSAYSSNSSQSQTSLTPAGSSKLEKLVDSLAEVKDAGKTPRVQEQGGVSGDCDTDHSRLQRSMKRIRGFQIGNTKGTSQGVALSVTSFHKQQRKRMAKAMVASPEAGAEAGVESGEEAAMPPGHKAKDSTVKKVYRRQRKSLFGHRRKPSKTDTLIKHPKLGRIRSKRVFYTYVVDSLSATQTPDGKEQPLQGHNITASVSEPSQDSCINSTSVTSARSSRIIKVPKRFLDEEIIPFPKGSLSTWLKSQTKEDGKLSPCHESSSVDHSLHSDSDSVSMVDNQSAMKNFSSKSSRATSHLEIYKNLKKLTLKLAEKKRGRPIVEADHSHEGDGLTPRVKKRRRSKIMMEEMDAPGVVRKLAVVVNTDVEKPSDVPMAVIDKNSKNFLFLV